MQAKRFYTPHTVGPDPSRATQTKSLTNLVKNARELVQITQLHQVKPGDVHNPLGRFGLHAVQIQSCATWKRRRQRTLDEFMEMSVAHRTFGHNKIAPGAQKEQA